MLSGDCMRKNSKDKYIGQMYKSNRGDIAEIVKYNSDTKQTSSGWSMYAKFEGTMYPTL